jgi:hypothetical protein
VNGSIYIKKHLGKIHKLDKGKELLPQRLSVIKSLQRHTPQSIQRLDLAEGDRSTLTQLKFQEALIAFVCCVHIAFLIVESEWFIALLMTLSDLVPNLLPKSHNTVREWVMNNYEKKKIQVKKVLHSARSNIHLSFDLWSSPNHYIFNAVVAHFVNADYKVASILIGFRNLFGPYSGANIAGSVQAVCQEYNIEDKLGCFVLDNATNNDTCIEALGAVYGWDCKEQKQRRLRCFDHIINLVTHAFILGEKQKIFEQALEAAENDHE